jgi:uncharacterized RDD family membrane protein YckC
MARRMGNWLEGPAEPLPHGAWPGQRLGLPDSGQGAVATTGSRLLALLVDLLVGGLIGALFFSLLGDAADPRLRSTTASAAFALQLLVLQSLTGQSIGMRLLRIRVARLTAPAGPPGLLPVAVRTALLCLVLPAVVQDADGRGLHDRAGGTVVLRT